jgi:hypothetical protein
MLQDPQAEHQIALAVETLRDDVDLRQAQVARAAEFAKRHGWAQIVSQQAQIYRHLLAGESSTP